MEQQEQSERIHALLDALTECVECGVPREHLETIALESGIPSKILEQIIVLANEKMILENFKKLIERKDNAH